MLLSADVLEALAAKGSLVGIIGAASAVSPSCRAWLAANPKEAAAAPSGVPVAPTMDEWAAHADYVIRTVGAEHAAIGLDLAGPRPAVPRNASGYPDLLAALRRVTTEQNVRAVGGENWLRVLEHTLGG